MIDEPFLSPILLNLAVTSALGVTERSIGASTLNLKAKIRLAGGKSVDLEDVISSEAGTVNIAGGHGGGAAGYANVQWISRLEGSGYRP